MQRTTLPRYFVAMLATVAAAAGYWVHPAVGLAAFPLAVLTASLTGGLGPGLAATITATLGIVYLQVRPGGAVESSPVPTAVVPLLLMVAGIVIALVISRLRRETARARCSETDAERRLAATDRLYQLSSAVSRATTPTEVLAASLSDVVHALDVATGAAFMLSPDGTVCELSQNLGYPELRPGSAVPFPIAAVSPLNDAIQRRELLVVSSHTCPAVNHAATIPELHDGDIVLPVVSNGRAVAALVLGAGQDRVFNDADREFLLAAGRQAAHAFARSQSYDAAERGRAEAEALRVNADSALQELQRAEEALRLSETRCRTLAARANRLYAFSAGLSQAVALDAVACVIVGQGKLVAGASAGSVALVSDDGKHLQVLCSEEYGAESQVPHRLPLTRGLCSTAAVATRQPVFVGSFAEWQEKYPDSAAIAADGGYVSSATLPLLADSSVVGVVCFHFTVPVNFDDDYVELLTSVALHCAQAVDRARMYEAAENARREAETANRSKDEFLSTISHELRTPLNAILGWAALLRKGVVDASRTQRALDAIFNNATRQGRLIEELLDVSRIVAGRAAIDLQRVDLCENVRGAVETMMPMAAAKGVELCFEPQTGIAVTADPRRLEQIFLNLLTNAVKFTPAGGRISAQVRRSGPSAEVRVVDTGVGIEQAFLPHVFERFRQADSATTRAVGGLGLGLFISRQLVEAQGGRLEADSNGPGTGATFVVTLPAVGAAAERFLDEGAGRLPAPEAEALPSLQGLSVLVVDDEPDSVDMMSAALRACGASVVSASSARDALHMLERVDVDLLLSDIAMPGEDGCALIRTIRAMPSIHLSALPAAAVTADARDDERTRALAAGFHMHLSKPVQPAALANAVAALALNRTV
jgi:signal transduction histidine kinase/ActR/RegA family two-component response regulator